MSSSLSRFESAPIAPRIRSLVAAVLVAIASGTPYVYSVFVPQLVKNSSLPVTVASKLSLFLTLGSGCGGFPAGILIDNLGPGIADFLGSISTFIAYKILHYVYTHQSQNVTLLAISMSCIGFGSILSFYSTVKVATANFPHHRGSAGAFPVSSYALASLMYSSIALRFYENDTAGLLKFFYTFCPAVCFLGSFSLKIIKKPSVDVEQFNPPPPSSNDSQSILKRITSTTSLMDSFNQRRRSLRGSLSFWGVGNRTPRQSITESNQVRPLLENTESTSSDPSEFYSAVEDTPIFVSNKHPVWDHYIVKIILQRIFLKYYIILACLQGIGQMYIYSVGFIVVAQVNSTPGNRLTVGEAQAIQVSTLALASFLGRLISGPVSDIIRRKFGLQRIWCILFSALLMSLGQFLVAKFNSVNGITGSSMIIGFAFGFVFGTFPAVVADSFGTDSFSTIWGLITTGGIISVGILTKLFGSVLDKQSDENGVCIKGVECYKSAFILTGWFSLFISGLILLTIFINFRKGVRG